MKSLVSKLITSTLRAVLASAIGYLAAKGIITQDQGTQLVVLISGILATVLWSYIEKRIENSKFWKLASGLWTMPADGTLAELPLAAAAAPPLTETQKQQVKEAAASL